MATVVVPDDITSRRLRFVVRALAKRYGTSTLIFVSRKLSDDEIAGRFANFEGYAPNLVGDWRTIVTRSLQTSVPRLRAELRGAPRPIVGMGFASLALIRAAGAVADVWVVRGIPEELVLHQGLLVGRARAGSRWRLAWLAGKPGLGIAVSTPMATMLSKRTRVKRAVAIPNTVDTWVFEPPAHDAPARTFLTYLGSGAPWQAVDLLEAVWFELAQMDASLRFRVISRDERTREIGRRLGDRVQLTEASQETGVAKLLWEARAAFLLRRPGPENEASLPVKHGEYLAAGAPVVTTDLGWDPARIVREHDAGIVVSPSATPRKIADQVLPLLASPTAPTRARAAAREVDNDVWVDRLVAMLP
jgi:glycosyltransferase involved in cell wall biosynthesis